MAEPYQIIPEEHEHVFELTEGYYRCVGCMEWFEEGVSQQEEEVEHGE